MSLWPIKCFWVNANNNYHTFKELLSQVATQAIILAGNYRLARLQNLCKCRHQFKLAMLLQYVRPSNCCVDHTWKHLSLFDSKITSNFCQQTILSRAKWTNQHLISDKETGCYLVTSINYLLSDLSAWYPLKVGCLPISRSVVGYQGTPLQHGNCYCTSQDLVSRPLVEGM